MLVNINILTINIPCNIPKRKRRRSNADVGDIKIAYSVFTITGVIKVKNTQANDEYTRTLCALYVSLSQPPKTCVNEYPQKNIERTDPYEKRLYLKKVQVMLRKSDETHFAL